MFRRRLQLRYSSDEEDEDEIGTSRVVDSVQSVGLASSVQPETSVASSSYPYPGEAIAVSEVEIIDVFGNPTPSPPDSTIPTPSPVEPLESYVGNDYHSPIGEVLSRMGIKVKREWWVSCLAGLEISVPQFSRLAVVAKAKHCFERFLFSDMNLCGGGVLPRNVASMNRVELAGPFVLQVDEIVNISFPIRGRYENANTGLKRCLKLSMTDGVQRLSGMEYRPIKDLKVLDPAGFKIVVSNVQIRHGLLMLVPEIIQVLGGMVEELEEAKKRLVIEVNKPPRGKRARSGVVPSLATRATLAAWSLNENNAGNHVNSSASGNVSHAHANGQGKWTSDNLESMEIDFSFFSGLYRKMHSTLNITRTHISPRKMDEHPASINVETTVSRVEHMLIDTASDLHSISCDIHSTASTGGTSYTWTKYFSNNVGQNILNQQTSNVTSFVEEMHIDNGRVRDTISPVYGSGSGAVRDAEVSNMVVYLEIPSVRSTDTENPFTYLAELAQKWAVMKDTMHFVQGKIKCFLTGVKKFQFKQQSTYELLCYVDDGSMICEILLHNDVVQKRIGHSSMEVSAALSSSAPATVKAMMKEKFKRFQLFLADFEGIMVVEMNRSSQYPVAVEMNQGCSTKDARLLFEKIKSSATTFSCPVVVLSP